MNKILINILIIVFATACSEVKKSGPENLINQNNPQKNQIIQDRIAYLKNPEPTDTICLSDIKRAKKDVANGKITYVQTVGFGYGYNRYETDLRKLCKEIGLEYDLDLIGCMVTEGQTQGCYGAYMDMVLIEKFGPKFKENLNQKADSLFLVRVLKDGTPIYSWDCDTEPKPILKNQTYLETTLDVPNIDLKRTDLGKTWPAIDLSFIIERNGKISKFYSNNYIPQLEHNEKFKDQLYQIAVEYIKNNYPDWEPGKIKEVPVRTDHNLRITFIGE